MESVCAVVCLGFPITGLSGVRVVSCLLVYSLEGVQDATTTTTSTTSKKQQVKAMLTLYCEQYWPGAAQVDHTHRTSRQRGWPRGFGALNSSPHSRIFAFVSVGSTPRSYLFISATGRIVVHTAPQCGTKPIRHVMLFFRDRRRAASLRHRNRAATTVLVCEQKQYPV